MSLPPFKHTRNPALEKEDEFHEYATSRVPLIIHNGVVEKRKTTDLKLIRAQPPHEGVEFEYLPVLPNPSFIVEPLKRNSSNIKEINTEIPVRENNENTNFILACPNNNIKNDKSANNDTKLMNKIAPNSKEMSQRVNEEPKELSKMSRDPNEHFCKNCKTLIKRNRDTSLKSRASNGSVNSRRSSKSVASIESSIVSGKDIVDRRNHSPRASNTLEFRYPANGLDEDDQYPHRRRQILR